MRLIRKLVNGTMNVCMAALAVCAVFLAGCAVTKCTPYIVLSGSMEPMLQTGSLCVVDTKVPFGEIKAGDVIAFEASTGRLVTHRAVAFRDGFIETKGDANAVTDGFTTSEANYRGKTLYSIPYLGYALNWLQTARGKIIAATGVMMLILSSMFLDDREKSRRVLEEVNE